MLKTNLKSSFLITFLIICNSLLNAQSSLKKEIEFLQGNTRFDSNGLISYQEIFEFNDKTELYKDVKLWISDLFKSTKAVIDYDDKDSGIIKVKGAIPYDIVYMGVLVNWKVQFHLLIELKQGKSRLTMDGFVTSCDNPPFFSCNAEEWFKECKGCVKKVQIQHMKSISSAPIIIFSSFKENVPNKRSDF